MWEGTSEGFHFSQWTWGFSPRVAGGYMWQSWKPMHHKHTHQGSGYPDVLQMKPNCFIAISWPWLSFLLAFQCSWPKNKVSISHEM